TETSSRPSLGTCGYPQPFFEALVSVEEEARQSGKPSALVLVSIDNLSMIMSGYSTAVAEAVMDELAHVLTEIDAAHIEIMRVQRDQFGILLSDTNDQQVARWCELAEDAIRNYSYSSRYGELHCLSSTAFQMLPDTMSDPSETLGRVLVALTETPLEPALAS